MNAPNPHFILTLNTGSSSLKIGLYRKSQIVFTGEVERIGHAGSRVRLRDDRQQHLLVETRDFADHRQALQFVLNWLKQEKPDWQPNAIGHRVVYGGLHHREPTKITAKLVEALQQMVPVAPDHLPQALSCIRLAMEAFADLPQVACFDTAFHRHMPRVAQLLPLPRMLADKGMIRFGFHGLSYESIMDQIRQIAPDEANGRIVIAHLGNGASMSAVRNGVGIDTTMGMTPAGGLMMGTRSGDLDPGVLLYLLKEQKFAPEALNDLVNVKAGLLGISETSSDMRDLLEKETSDGRAAEAIALFCYQARKHLGALATVLGGIDTLIFTGGIGEHAAVIRHRICENLDFLGLKIDAKSNENHAAIISANGAPATIRVLQTDEDEVIAKQTRELVNA